MGGWVGASDKASTGRAEKARVGGVGDTENHRLKTFELYRQAKVRNPGRARMHGTRSAPALAPSDARALRRGSG
jgi:hypothetical protein